MSQDDDWDSLTQAPQEDRSYIFGASPPPAVAKPAVSGAPAAVAAETMEQTLEAQLNQFLQMTLPGLNSEQFFSLICAIPHEHWPKEEEYEGEEDGKVTLDGLLQRMQKAVKAMYNQVFINGRVKQGIDVGEVQKTVNACRDSFKAVLSFEKEIYTLKRQQAVETATVNVLKEKFPEMVDPFLEALEEELNKAN